MTPKKVAIYPCEALRERNCLFEILGGLFPVTFVEGTPNPSPSCDAQIVIGPESGNNPDHRLPSLHILTCGKGAAAARSGAVEFSSDPEIHRALRGRTLSESALRPSSLSLPAGYPAVLASVEGSPVWAMSERAGAFVTSIELADVSADESIRSQLCDGKFMGMLPLVDFLRRLTADRAFIEPPLRANFIVDDPNIRFTRYGFLDYRVLLSEGRRHGYHVTLATIPLDLWWASSSSVELFRSGDDTLSLAIHGNNHTHHEMECADEDGSALAFGSHALRRVQVFEQKYSVRIGRVFVPPHSRCSAGTLRALLRLGVPAVCMGRRWLGESEDWTPADFHAPGSLDWYPAALVAGGMPIITRKPKLADLTFRAYLSKPIIEYFHQDSCAQGPGEFAQTAAAINALGPVNWMSLEKIALSNYAYRVDGEVMYVRPYSLLVDVEVPERVNAVVIVRPDIHGETILINSARVGNAVLPFGLLGDQPMSREFPVVSGTRLSVSLLSMNSIGPSAVPIRTTSLAPAIRRLGTEMRDRLVPIWHR